MIFVLQMIVGYDTMLIGHRCKEFKLEMEDRRSVWLLVILAIFLGLLAFVSTPQVLFIEGELAQGFDSWCSSSQWVQMSPDLAQLELGSARHPGCQRITSVALLRLGLVSLATLLFGKIFLKQIARQKKT